MAVPTTPYRCGINGRCPTAQKALTRRNATCTVPSGARTGPQNQTGPRAATGTCVKTK